VASERRGAAGIDPGDEVTAPLALLYCSGRERRRNVTNPIYTWKKNKK